MELNILTQIENLDQTYNQVHEQLLCLIRRRPYCRITKEQQEDLLNQITLDLHSANQDLNQINRRSQILQTRTQQTQGQRSTLMFISHQRTIIKQKISYLNLKKLIIESLA